MVPGGGVERDEGGAGLGHAGLLPWNLICLKATVAAPSVQAKWVSKRSFVFYICPRVVRLPVVFKIVPFRPSGLLRREPWAIFQRYEVARAGRSKIPCKTHKFR